MARLRLRWATLLIPLLVIAVSACGSGSSSPRAAPSPVKLYVFAGAKLMPILPKLTDLFSKAHSEVSFDYTYADVRALSAQIVAGAVPDVYAGPYTAPANQLVADKVIASYKIFCTSALVLVTPKENPAGITSLQDLATKPVKLAIASATGTAGLGKLTRTVLTNLDAIYGSDYSTTVLGKVVTEDLTKIQTGEVNAEFSLISDVMAGGTQVNTIAIPAGARPYAPFPVAVLKKSKKAATARQFIDFLLTAPAQAMLKQAGYSPPSAPTP